MPVSVNWTVPYPLSLFAFFIESQCLNFCPCYVNGGETVEMTISKRKIYTKKGHGIILYWVIKMLHEKFLNAKD